MSKLLDEDFRLSSVATSKDRPCVFVKEADLVRFLTLSSEIGTITVVNQREDTAADGNARSANVSSLLPGGAKGANLAGLLDVERLTALVELEGGGLQVHSELGSPGSCRVGSGPPPNALTQSSGVRLEA